MPPVIDDDDELFIEIDDYESAEGGVAPQRFGAPHAQDQHGARQPPSGEGVGRGGIRRPPLLDVEGKYLTNEELSALEDEFEDVTPRKGMKLPGMASTPGGRRPPLVTPQGTRCPQASPTSTPHPNHKKLSSCTQHFTN